MKETMDFEICKKEHLREVEPDPAKIKSILKVADARLKAMKKVKEDDETASIIV